MDQFVNKRVDAGDFLGDSVIELHKRLSKEVDNQTKIQLVDEYFNLMIESKKIERDRFDASVDYIDEKLGNISLQEVMDEYGFSSRYYQKLFIKRVGVSPKSYLRLRRMSRICHLLSTQKEIDWQDIVFEGGYFDQSHFIKDFLDFIGRNPSVYFKDNKELARLLR
jgi:AraC-like DNA-binding protein